MLAGERVYVWRVRRIGRWLQIPLSDFLILAEALASLAVSRAAVWLLPFRWLASAPRYPGAVDEEPPEGRRRAALRVGWAVRTVARRGNVLANCLCEAIAARWMLRRRGVSAALHLGVQSPESGFKAHAWLEAAGQPVGGVRRSAGYVRISTVPAEFRPGDARRPGDGTPTPPAQA